MNGYLTSFLMGMATACSLVLVLAMYPHWRISITLLVTLCVGAAVWVRVLEWRAIRQ